MNYRIMFTINAVVLALFGLGFLILPDFMLSQFNAEIYVIVNFICRFLGGILFLLAWFLWLLKDTTNAKQQRSLAMVLLGSSVAGFALTVMGMSRESIGVIRSNGWMLLTVYGLFILIYGYMLFLQPKEQRQRSSSKKGKNPAPDAYMDQM